MTYKQESIKPYDENGKKGEQVEQMFDRIAHSYDLLNHALSFGIDKHWRKAAIHSLKPHSAHHARRGHRHRRLCHAGRTRTQTLTPVGSRHLGGHDGRGTRQGEAGRTGRRD